MSPSFRHLLATACLIAGLGAGAAHARPFCSDPAIIPLLNTTGSRGSSVFEYHNVIRRGELACFRMQTPAATNLHVTVSSAEKTAVFQLYAPGWKIVRQNGGFRFTGQTLPGAAEGDDARSWTGQYPGNGSILIVIGLTRGGGQYRLHVEVR